MNSLLQRFGFWVCRHRRAVISAWVVTVFCAAFSAARLETALVAGSGSVSGSQSERVESVLQEEFAIPFTRSLLLALSSTRYTVEDGVYRQLIDRAAQRLRELPEVEQVASYLDTQDRRMRSGDGHDTALLIGLRAASFEQEERAVPQIRAALAGVKAQMLREDPAARFAVTGHAALTYDVNEYNRRDGRRAEARALPLALIVMLAAFGALVAAGVPLASGLASTTVASALAFAVAALMPVSNLLQNIVAMVGLGLGIDYSLLIVSRFREALRSHSVEGAVALVMGEAGSAIVYSGTAVAIGFCGLLFTPLMETRSIGVGGMLVVVVSVVATLTLVPALLAWLGPRIDQPRWMSRPLGSLRAEQAWNQTGRWVTQHPWTALALALPLLGALAWPALRGETGFTNRMDWFPPDMESRVGGEILAQMGESNAIIPLYVVVRSTDGTPVLGPKHVRALAELTDAIRSDPRAGSVSQPDAQHASRDHSAVMLQVVPANGLPLRDAEHFARELSQQRLASLKIEVGGTPAYYNDFNDAMRASLPRVLAFVVGASLVVLGLAFRSILIPLKAVAANLLAVAAGYGAVVAVFQLGWLSFVPGFEQPLSAIPLTIPLLILCITFGLSMDYEIFLLCRIKQIYDTSGDNSGATVAGLAATATIITSAALIMAIVFGAALGAEIAIIRMVGLGLAVTVLVDATLIRILVVPAVMAIAGRWNWYPGHRPAVAAPRAVVR